jgi:hypothetical protein
MQWYTATFWHNNENNYNNCLVKKHRNVAKSSEDLNVFFLLSYRIDLNYFLLKKTLLSLRNNINRFLFYF